MFERFFKSLLLADPAPATSSTLARPRCGVWFGIRDFGCAGFSGELRRWDIQCSLKVPNLICLRSCVIDIHTYLSTYVHMYSYMYLAICLCVWLFMFMPCHASRLSIKGFVQQLYRRKIMGSVPRTWDDVCFTQGLLKGLYKGSTGV